MDRTGLGALGVAARGLVGFALASASASFLLAAVSVVTKEERAKFDAVNCWKTVVLLAAVRPSCLGLSPASQWLQQGLG